MKFINDVLQSFDRDLGREAWRVPVREGMTAITSNVQEVLLEMLLGNRHVVLVDTPGFDHTELTDEEVFRRIAIWVRNYFSSVPYML